MQRSTDFEGICGFAASSSQSLVPGIVKRLGEHPSRVAFAQHRDLKLAAGLGAIGLDEGEGDALSDGVPVRAAGGEPDYAAVGIDRLAAVGVGVKGVDREIDKPALDALAGPLAHGVAANERAVESRRSAPIRSRSA